MNNCFKIFCLLCLISFSFYSCSEDSSSPAEEYIGASEANKLMINELMNATTSGIGSIFSLMVTEDQARINFLQLYLENARFLDDNTAYVYCYDTAFIGIAHPILKNYIGVAHYNDVDSKGKYFAHEMKDSLTAHGKGWVEFYWYNQQTSTYDLKMNLVQMLKNTRFWLGTGFFTKYFDGSNIKKSELNKMLIRNIVHYTAKAFGDVHKYQYTDSLQFINFLRNYADSSRYFSDNSGYFFVDGLDGLSVAFPTRKELEGTSIYEMTDAKGTYSVKEMIEIVNTKGSGFDEYYFTNPKNNKTELKVVYVERIEGTNYFIGSGFYSE